MAAINTLIVTDYIRQYQRVNGETPTVERQGSWFIVKGVVVPCIPVPFTKTEMLAAIGRLAARPDHGARP